MLDGSSGSAARAWSTTKPLPVLLVWLPMLGWYAALRPGIMSADSLSVWRQAAEGDWVDVHPPAYTAAMWVSRMAVGDPSLLTLGQSLLLAAGIVALCRAVIRFGAPRMLVVVVAAALSLSPMVGGFALSLWKDVPYTGALLFVTARVVDLARVRVMDESDGRPVLRSLGVWLLVAVAMRQNGILFALALLGILFLILPNLRRALALLAAVVVGFLVVLKVAVYPLAGVHAAPDQAAVSMFLHDIAAVARSHPDGFEPSDRALLDWVAPFELWQAESAKFGCSTANWEWSEDFDWTRIEGRSGDYVRLWMEVAAEEPATVAGNRLCVGAIAFRPDTVGVLYAVSTGVDPNDLGLRTEPLVDGLHDLAVDLLRGAARPRWQWVLWRAPTWIYAAWGSLIVAAIRFRRPLLLLPGLPLIALQFSVFVVNPAQDARYMFAGLLAGVLLLPLATARRPVVFAPPTPPEPRQEAVPERRLESSAVMTFDAGGGDG